MTSARLLALELMLEDHLLLAVQQVSAQPRVVLRDDLGALLVRLRLRLRVRGRVRVRVRVRDRVRARARARARVGVGLTLALTQSSPARVPSPRTCAAPLAARGR